MTDMLGCRHPINLGAMGVICNPELVAAVSEAGGYGLLATAFVQNVKVLRGQIQETKKLTGLKKFQSLNNIQFRRKSLEKEQMSQ